MSTAIVKTNNLYDAHNQWASRPDDERYGSLEELHKAALAYYNQSTESTIEYRDLKVELFADDDDIALIGKSGKPAALTYTASKQLCQRIGAPHEYISRLSPGLAATNIQYGLINLETDKSAKLLFYNGGDRLAIRAFTGEGYARIWHHELTERVLNLRDDGWRLPPARPASKSVKGVRPATKADILGDNDFSLSVKEGDLIAPAGAYLGQGWPELFIFVVEPTQAIQSKQGRMLHRFAMISNSEIGDAKLRVKFGLYDHVCGNHILWNVEDVYEVAIKHSGGARKRAFEELSMSFTTYSNIDLKVEEQRVFKAQNYKLGDKKEEILDYLFGKKIAGKKELVKAWDIADAKVDSYGSPTTAWGFANGLTELSQQSTYTDERVALDNAAAKVIQFAF